MTPLVSVIVPVFNVEKYIEDCVISIQNQTYRNIEIILVDDGSTDKSGQICDLLKQKNNRIKVYHNQNKGVCFARNYAIKKAIGKYILPVDGDDIIANTYIEKAVKVLEEDDNIGIVYCKAKFFGKKNYEWNLPEFSLRRMLLSNIIFVTAIFRKNDWIAVGGFNERMKYGIEDYDFWLSIIELNRKVYKIPEILFYYRISNNTRSTKFASNKSQKEEMYKMIYMNHKSLYINNYEIMMEEFTKERLMYQEKINKLKAMIPFYFIFDYCPGLKTRLKKIFLGAFT